MARRRTLGRRLPGALRWPIVALLVVFVVAGGYALLEAAALSSAWNSIERVTLDAPADTTPPATDDHPADESSFKPADGEPDPPPITQGGSEENATTKSPSPEASPQPREDDGSAEPTPTPTPGTSTPSDPAETILTDSDEPPRVMALVGSDSREGLEDRENFGDFEGQRADVIILAIRSGDHSTLLSVPRDLYVEDRCRGGRHRIGDAFAGCGGRHGLANLVLELEHVTGLDVDHAVAVDLAGFESVVDLLGGYEICTDHAQRDPKSGLYLDAGCHVADGETTLAWLRSRRTQRQVNGQWETVPGVSDLSRNERQRQFALDMFRRLARDSRPDAILDVLRAVAPHLTIDDQLSMADAAAWIWELRDADIEAEEIPVRSQTSPDGAAVLVPTRDVEELAAGLISRE